MAADHQKFGPDDVNAALAAGDRAKALALLTGLSREAPDDPSILYKLGALHGELGHVAEAERDLVEAGRLAELAMRIDSTVAAATLLAKCLAGAGRQSDAARHFADSTQDGGARYELLMCYGQIFTQLGQRENAIAAYDAAAENNPLAVTENATSPKAWVRADRFTADNPSPRYAELIKQYALMHEAGRSDRQSQGAKTFEGFVGFAIVAPYVRRFRQELGARSLLDYGGGRGAQYDLGAITVGGETFSGPKAYLGIDRVASFDPGFNRELPSGAFDLVICVDALEHCDRQDLPWIVRQLFENARLGVFANVASYAAAKTLPSGENAHCTVENAPWWMALFGSVAEDFPAIKYRVIVSKDLRQNSRAVFGRRVQVPA